MLKKARNDQRLTAVMGALRTASRSGPWKALLRLAEVRDARLHDLRHTSATVLLELKVPLPAVMELMGWSNAAIAKRYMHVTSELTAAIADQVGNHVWYADDEREDEDEDEERQNAGCPVAGHPAFCLLRAGAVGFEPTDGIDRHTISSSIPGRSGWSNALVWPAQPASLTQGNERGASTLLSVALELRRS
ncbi:tyrosine-type recombinase/integrase [Amycolatopsis carbonis]|uniref:Tyrosine-type recombinase/integrase n=1 Tax=Amycolatopsis carbonis TaxID=715471 RepID=A0A9Y2MX49_9PSEU|nr:tyrosine-type recombinase/integrase [Amycolatopsis sp. 2-15]WIX78669.1 tyrosine-type recombinase/integrase [Amycolatopsis sp. 2-15]